MGTIKYIEVCEARKSCVTLSYIRPKKNSNSDLNSFAINLLGLMGAGKSEDFCYSIKFPRIATISCSNPEADMNTNTYLLMLLNTMILIQKEGPFEGALTNCFQ